MSPLLPPMHTLLSKHCQDSVACSLLMYVQAAQKPKGSIERLLLVAAFAQSAFQAVGKLKCMYPISGETYEVRLSGSHACAVQAQRMYVTQCARLLSVCCEHLAALTQSYVLQLVLPEKKMRLLVETVRAPSVCCCVHFCPSLRMYPAARSTEHAQPGCTCQRPECQQAVYCLHSASSRGRHSRGITELASVPCRPI